MAKTNKIAGFIKGPNGLERIPSRSAQTKPAGLYLLELRSHHAYSQSPVPRRRLVVTLDPQDSSHSGPKTVKIFHT